MDTFAVSISIGLSSLENTTKKSLITGLYFGVFQAGMPVIGYYAAALFADKITAFDHWGAFLMLCFLGGKMIKESMKKEKRPNKERSSDTDGDDIIEDEAPPEETQPIENIDPLRPSKMIPFAVATSIDALAVGISFAFLRVNLVPAVSLIGVTTFTISAIGVKIGGVFGAKFKTKAEFAGGVILILIGLKILLDHMGVI